MENAREAIKLVDYFVSKNNCINETLISGKILLGFLISGKIFNFSPKN